jgi:hypothetical protein
MKLVRTEDAVGHVLCHDMTQIIVGGEDGQRFKGPRFRKGHVVQAEDIPVLLSMGKENLYVWELEPGMLHEDDAARRMATLCLGDNTEVSGEPREGKIGIKATCDGVFLLDSARLRAVNSVDQVMIATRRANLTVLAGDDLAGTRVIPLVIEESRVAEAESAARVAECGPLMRVEPFKLKTAAIITTGSEVQKGRIKDRFTPMVEAKLAPFGITTTYRSMPGDVVEDIVASIREALAAGVDLVCCTGGMSVDPDDNTPGAIKRAGARIVTYGAPVLPGAMMLLGYFAVDGRTVPVCGLPGCVMYSKATVFDLLLPRIVAGVELTKADVVELGEGGLALKGQFDLMPRCPFTGEA